MSDQIEAAGAFATASLAAKALDQPAAGAAGHGGTCANCAAPLAGPFCAQCGQRAHLHRHVGEVFHEFLHGITHLDGKAWKTLPMLLFRPGLLTRSYIEGHRARYIAPVPMFLMVVFLMFFALSFVQLPSGPMSVGGNASKAARKAEAASTIAGIDAELAKAKARGDAKVVAQLEAGRAITAEMAKPDANVSSASEVLANEMKKAADSGNLSVNTGNAQMDDKARKALKNPSLVLYKLQTKAYKLSFLLVPLSLPWLWLAFAFRRGIGLYDHAIFTLYSISFMSLLFIVASLAFTAGIAEAAFWQGLALLPMIHMFAQLRGAYALGWWGAGWRTLYLSVAATITLTVYLIILVLVGILD